jgi:hypothetical protein
MKQSHDATNNPNEFSFRVNPWIIRQFLFNKKAGTRIALGSVILNRSG